MTDEVAAYEPDSGYADPFMTAAGFLSAAKQKGTRLVPGARVSTIRTAGGRVEGVDTNRGSVDAPVVVNAAGAWAGGVAALVDVDIPITVWRHDTGYLGVPGSVARPIPVVIDNANSMYFRPEGADMVLIGLEDDNQMGGSPDRDTTEAASDFRDRAAERIIRRVPGLIDGTFRTSHSGQDGLTPDQRPMLGAIGPDGFYLDCGHSGTGFKTAPAVGLGMAELILDGTATTVDLAPFAPGRFARGSPPGRGARRGEDLAVARAGAGAATGAATGDGAGYRRSFERAGHRRGRGTRAQVRDRWRGPVYCSGPPADRARGPRTALPAAARAALPAADEPAPLNQQGTASSSCSTASSASSPATSGSTSVRPTRWSTCATAGS